MEKNDEKQISERLNKAIREVIDNQIYDNEPPETAECLERLVEEGFSQDEAYTLIGRVVSKELTAVFVDQRPFDQEKYVKALIDLPTPYEEPKG